MSRDSSSFPHPLYDKYVLKPFYEDAQTYYFAPMLAANRAHVVMLQRCKIITGENAKSLLNALKQVEAMGVDELTYREGVEDLFFAMENRLIELAGAAPRRQSAIGAQPQRSWLCVDAPRFASAALGSRRRPAQSAPKLAWFRIRASRHADARLYSYTAGAADYDGALHRRDPGGFAARHGSYSLRV